MPIYKLLNLFLLALPSVVSASPLVFDDFTARQAAVIKSFKTPSTDTTSVLPSGKKPLAWIKREFKATIPEVCTAKTPGSAQIGTAGNSSLVAQFTNSKGTAEARWDIKKIPLSQYTLSFKAHDARAPKANIPQEITFTITVHAAAKRLALAKSIVLENGKSEKLTFDFGPLLRDLGKKGPINPSVIVLSIAAQHGCSTRIALSEMELKQGPVLAPQLTNHITAKSASRENTSNSAPYRSTPSSTQTPAPDCDSEPSIPDQIQKCEKANSSKCSKVKCSCTNTPDEIPGYSIDVLYRDFPTHLVGTSCWQTGICDGFPGACNDQGQCSNPNFLHPDTLKKYFPKGMYADCIDLSVEPSDELTCAGTEKDILDYLSKVLLPAGTPCEMLDVGFVSKVGSCDGNGACILQPDAPEPDECLKKEDCRDCDPAGSATNGACYGGRCRSMSEFEAINCEGYSHECRACIGAPVCNPEGKSYKIVATNEGGQCSRTTARGETLGICRRGSCTAPSTPTPSPTRSGSR